MLSTSVIELPLEDKAQRFMSILKDHSTNKQDPISEWAYVYEEPNHTDQQKYCICTTKITNLHVIRNKISGYVLEVGSECIKKWELAPVCAGCDGAIGSLVKRRKTNDWYCRKCKKANDMEARVKQIEKELLLKRLGKQVFFGYFSNTRTSPWYGKRFEDVVKDPRLVKLTLEKEVEHPDYWSFREYLILHQSVASHLL